MIAYIEMPGKDDDTLVVEADGEIIKEIKDFSKGHIEVDGRKISFMGWHLRRILSTMRNV